jgi:adenylyltransferase/sulfurtransferase
VGFLDEFSRKLRREKRTCEMTADPLERYSRQIRFPGVGESGQGRLLLARAAICGCGALGTVLANTLARAGVGRLRIIDRDFVESNNLQRQVLFDEQDVESKLPKAVAAAAKLGRVNSQIEIEPVVADIDRRNVLSLVADASVILDGTDNFEVRYLLNDAAVSLNKPWVYGGCVGSQGQTMTIVPGETPCLRCLFPAAPAPGDAATCEVAGVLGPIVSVVASIQAAEAIKLLVGDQAHLNRSLVYIDIWENTWRRFDIAKTAASDCPCCRKHQFDWLDGKHGSQTVALCGRNAVQVSPEGGASLDLAKLAKDLKGFGPVSANKYLVRLDIDGFQFTVFADGRAIIKGTDDPEKARTLYARYIGH